MRIKLYDIIFVILIALFAISCGGGGSAPIETPEEQNPQPVVAGEDFQNWVEDVEFTPEPKSYRGIPPIPIDTDDEHSASEVEDFVVLGKDALDFSQCEVSGNAMVINVDGVAATNVENVPAWAMYKIGGLRDKDPFSLNVESYPDEMGMEYYVAVADYTILDWRWFGPASIPEYQILLGEEHQYVTHLGNLYFLVICYGGSIATHHQSTVVCGVEDEIPLPGAPQRLVASKGEFEDGVGLTWLPGADAASYEVYRRGMIWWADNGLPPGTAGGMGGWFGGDPADPRPDTDPPEPYPDEWMLLTTTEETSYFDSRIGPGLIYSYKVRSVNETGVSRFSNIDEGWAEIIGPPPIEGIHGYVFGQEWRPLGGGDPNVPPGGDPSLPPGSPEDGGPGSSGDWPPDGDPTRPPGDPTNPPGTRCDPPVATGIFPLAGAILSLIPEDGREILYHAVSDQEGFYQFWSDTTAAGGMIPSGRYILTCELEGWVFSEIYLVEVPQGSYSLQFDFVGFKDIFDPPGDPEKGIHGYVWDSFGCIIPPDPGDPLLGGIPPNGNPGGDGGMPIREPWPLPGVLITFLNIETGDIAFETHTDADGFYQALRLGHGAYEITAALDGWGFDPPAHYATVGADGVPTVCLDFVGFPASDPPPPDPTFIGLYGWIWGEELFGSNPFGRMPLPGVTISVNGLITDEHFGTAISDNDGYFNFPNLPAGEYAVHAMLPGWLFQPELHAVIIEEIPVEIMFFGIPANGGDPDNPPPGGDPNVPPGGDPSDPPR